MTRGAVLPAPARPRVRLPLPSLTKTATIVAVFVAWELAAGALSATGDRLSQMKLPFPHLVLLKFASSAPDLLSAAWETAQGALIGLAVGTFVAVVLGMLMAQTKWMEYALYPYLVAAQMIPTIALAPIVYGAVRDPVVVKVIVAAYISVFAVSLGVIKGLQSTSIEGLELMRTFNAGRLQVLRMLRLPSALPYFFAGLKVAAPLAVVGEIVVELAGSKDGLGTLIVTTQYYGPANAHLFWSAILATLLLGWLFQYVVSVAERLLTPWQPSFRR